MGHQGGHEGLPTRFAAAQAIVPIASTHNSSVSASTRCSSHRLGSNPMAEYDRVGLLLCILLYTSRGHATNNHHTTNRTLFLGYCALKGGPPQADEWEEKWGEQYWSTGRADKWADKWGKEGNNVWHERWGEDYDGHGGCVKWTDKVSGCSTCMHRTPSHVLMRDLWKGQLAKAMILLRPIPQGAAASIRRQAQVLQHAYRDKNLVRPLI